MQTFLSSYIFLISYNVIFTLQQLIQLHSYVEILHISLSCHGYTDINKNLCFSNCYNYKFL